MLQVKLPVINPQSAKFVRVVKNKATGDSKLNDSSDIWMVQNTKPALVFRTKTIEKALSYHMIHTYYYFIEYKHVHVLKQYIRCKGVQYLKKKASLQTQ